MEIVRKHSSGFLNGSNYKGLDLAMRRGFVKIDTGDFYEDLSRNSKFG